MSRTFKKYCALTILGVFLFAFGEKNIHDIIHGDEFHCTAKHEHHFHNQEHHCFICDFYISLFDDSSAQVSFSFILSVSHVPFQVSDSELVYSYHTSFFNRGPPASA